MLEDISTGKRLDFKTEEEFGNWLRALTPTARRPWDAIGGFIYDMLNVRHIALIRGYPHPAEQD
jgi:hypothetical protein